MMSWNKMNLCMKYTEIRLIYRYNISKNDSFLKTKNKL